MHRLLTRKEPSLAHSAPFGGENTTILLKGKYYHSHWVKDGDIYKVMDRISEILLTIQKITKNFNNDSTKHCKAKLDI